MINRDIKEIILIQCLKVEAEQGYYNGIPTRKSLQYLKRVSGNLFSKGMCICLIYSRDIGLHSSGWLKNPDYERCYHLSVSFKNALTMEPIPYDLKKASQISKSFFLDNTKLLWIEGPFSNIGKKLEVYHYRLFCDKHWNPIMPRKEVYSKDFTEIGWKSFSEVHPESEMIFWGGGQN